MLAESLAIITVILLTAGIFVRAKKKAVAVLTLPLISVPLFYLLARIAYPLIAWNGPYDSFAICIMIIGVVLGAAACSLISLIIPTKKGKTGYIVFCLIFQVAIAIGYAINIM